MSDEKVFGGAKLVYTARIVKESVQDEMVYSDEVPHPYSPIYGDAIAYYSYLPEQSAWHAGCLSVKADCTVSMGFDITGVSNEAGIKDRLEVVNDKGQSFIEVMNRVAYDYESGNGYLEVVRDGSGYIAELYHIPPTTVWLRPTGCDTEFRYRNRMGNVDLPAFRAGDSASNSILHFSKSSVVDVYYGLPEWRGCIPDIRLAYYASLYNQKFFINSGIPDFAIITEGGKFDADTEKKVTEFVQQNFKGFDNAHRTLYLPITNPSAKVRFEKIASDLKDRDSSFEKLNIQSRDSIIGAHRVPSRLLSIMSAGQLGGGGEVSSQIGMFQEVTINPRQTFFESKIGPILNDMGFPGAKFRFRKINTRAFESPSQFYPAMVTGGILTVDEARAELGYGPKVVKPQEAGTPAISPERLLLKQLRQKQAMYDVR